MPDVSLSILITRTALGLGDLQLNDHTSYTAAPSSPAQVSWQRQSISSPYVDDDITVSRRRPKVMEEMLFEVKGSSAGVLQTNLAALISAFSQNSFTITSSYNGATYAWSCEAADYQVVWSGPRHVAKQFQVHLQVPRSPVPLSGPF